MPTDDDLCACGDVRGEHEEGRACTVMNCPCSHFESVEDDD